MDREVLSALYARVPLGVRLGLDAMRAAMDALGHPERGLEVVHVAGTNGKGSVSAMVEAIARADGRRTGLYTSPHLSRFNERIQIDGAPIDDAALTPLVARALAIDPPLSFFEVATTAALLAFREAKVDIAVLEVGLGGRLDATNVVPAPRAAAITRIAFDHMDKLGSTLVAIGREKAGIAKPGLDIVLGPMPDDAVRAAIDEVARAAGATTSLAVDDAEAVALARSARVALPGAHQRDNALVAAVLGKRIGASREARLRGLAEAKWPGRLETIATPEGPVLLDAAHNPDGAEALARHLATTGPGPQKTALVFGALADKDFRPMLDRLAPLARTRVYAPPSGRKAAEPTALAALHPGAVAENAARAIELARASRPELVVVAGSIYLVGEARAHILELPTDPPVAM